MSPRAKFGAAAKCHGKMRKHVIAALLASCPLFAGAADWYKFNDTEERLQGKAEAKGMELHLGTPTQHQFGKLFKSSDPLLRTLS
jgi:hypothetical protein